MISSFIAFCMVLTAYEYFRDPKRRNKFHDNFFSQRVMRINGYVDIAIGLFFIYLGIRYGVNFWAIYAMALFGIMFLLAGICFLAYGKGIIKK